MIDRVTALEVVQARHAERIGQTEDCMDKQNGRLERIEEKLDQQNQSLMRLMGGIIATLILLVVNLAVGR